MKEYQFSIYKEALKHFSLETESDIRKHIFIAILMDIQISTMATYGDEYKGNCIKVLDVRDILGHKTYLTAINEIIESGIFTRTEATNGYNRRYHRYDQMDLTFDRKYTLPLSIKRVNNSIDKYKARKLDFFSNGGNIVLKNLQDQRFGINCTKEEY